MMRRGGLRPRSLVRARQERVYNARRPGWLADHPACAVCWHRAEQVHHMAGRDGYRLLDESRWLPVCADCHRRITDNPTWAEDAGWSVKRHAS